MKIYRTTNVNMSQLHAPKKLTEEIRRTQMLERMIKNANLSKWHSQQYDKYLDIVVNSVFTCINKIESCNSSIKNGVVEAVNESKKVWPQAEYLLKSLETILKTEDKKVLTSIKLEKFDGDVFTQDQLKGINFAIANMYGHIANAAITLDKCHLANSTYFTQKSKEIAKTQLDNALIKTEHKHDMFRKRFEKACNTTKTNEKALLIAKVNENKTSGK